MRKPTQAESGATLAIKALNAKVATWRTQMREATEVVISLEQSGVVPIHPDAAKYDLSAAAHARMNGATYVPAPTGDRPGVELFLKRREVEELKHAIELASQQEFAARQDLGRELLAKHDNEIRVLHRERALVILKLFKINGELEQMRLKLIREGSSMPHPLDGWSQRFFGLANPNTALNAWPKKYLAECLKQKIITEKDIEA